MRVKQTYNAERYADAQRLCWQVCQHYGLSAASTDVALRSAAERWQGAGACYRAILNSLTWER